MQIKVTPQTFFVFDLDDTLFQEIDYLKSAYRAIAARLQQEAGEELYEEMWARFRKKENVFGWLIETYGSRIPFMDKAWLLREYREHRPALALKAETDAFLKKAAGLGIPSGLITDGRSRTQRAKLSALGLEHYFSDLIISEEFGSEKPSARNYLFFEEKYGRREFYFFGDNTSKDFLVPAQLGWRTICIKDSGFHIHPQELHRDPCPDFVISGFGEINLW